MLLMKSLKSGGRPRHYKHEGREIWPLPSEDGQPGAWFGNAVGTLKPHANGFHLAQLNRDAILWFDQENYIAEVPYDNLEQAVTDGDIVIDEDCVIARQARLVRKLEMTNQDWRDLAFKLAEPVIRMPSYLDLPNEYAQSLEYLFFYLRDGYAPNAQSQNYNAFLEGVVYLIERSAQDARSTMRYRDCPEAISEAGKCIYTLALFNNYDADHIDITKKVADLAVRSFRFAALSFDASDTSFTNNYLKGIYNHIPDDMPERFHGNIAHRALFNVRKQQNELLLRKFGIPKMALDFRPRHVPELTI